MAVGQDGWILSSKPKEEEKKQEGWILSKPEKKKYDKTHGYDRKSIGGILGNIGTIIGETAKGVGKDVAWSFSKKNPLLGPAIEEISQDPTRIITDLPSAAIHAASGIPAGIIGETARVGAAIPKVMGGKNVFTALGEGDKLAGGISKALTYPTTETGKAMVTASMAPLATLDQGISEAAKLIAKDETKQAGVLAAGRILTILAAMKAGGELKVREFAKVRERQLDRFLDGLKDREPLGVDISMLQEERAVPMVDDFGAVYGEGGSVIGTMSGGEMVRPKLGPSTGKGPNPTMRWAEQNIKRISPPLYSKLKDYLFERDSNAGRDVSMLASVDKLMTKALGDMVKGKPTREIDSIIHTRIADMVEGRSTPSNALEEFALNQYKRITKGVERDIALLKEQGETMTIRGLGGEKEWSPVQGYYPRVYSNLQELLESSSPNGLHAQDVIGNRLAARMYPEEFANPATKANAVAKALEVARNFSSKTKTKKYGHLESSRLLQPEDVASLEAEGILKREYGTNVIVDYIKKTQDRLAWTRNFGTDVVWNGQKVPRVFAEALVNTTNPKAKEFIVTALERAGGGKTSPFGRISEKLNVLSTPKMILATPANMQQWLGNTVPLQPLTDVPATVWETVKKNFGDKTFDKFYRDSGIQITPERVIERVGTNPEIARKSQTLFYKLSGFTGTEASNSFYAGRAGARKAVTLSERLANRPNAYRAKAWEQQLKQLGIDSLTISEIKAGEVLGIENLDMLHRAAWEMKRMSQFASDMFARPLSFSSPNAPAFRKFKNFPISQLQNFGVDAVLKPAWEFARTGGKMGDITPLLKAPITLGVAGALTTGMKSLVWDALGKKDMYDRFLKNKPFIQQWMFFITQAGGLGIATDLMLATNAERLVTNIAGPLFSDAYEIGKGFYDVRKEVEAAYKAKSFRLIYDRRKKIAKVWADKLGKMQPAVKMALTKFWPDYVNAKTHEQWEFQYSRARADYMNLLEYQGQAAADEYWGSILDTWGQEYLDVVGHFPEKPTEKETGRYQENKMNPLPKR